MATTTDPALSERTFLRNPTLIAALGRIATMTPKPIISDAEVDCSDDRPEPPPTLGDAAYKIECAVAWLESDIRGGVIPELYYGPIVQWLKSARAILIAGGE